MRKKRAVIDVVNVPFTSAQASIELLMILAISFAVLLFIVSFNQDLFTITSNQFEVSKAKAAVQELASASTLVQAQGVGAKTSVYLTLPRGIQTITFNNKTIAFNLKLTQNVRSVYQTLGFDVAGNINPKAGPQWIRIEAKEAYVLIGNETDSFAPVVSNVAAGSVTNTSASITWNTNEDADSKVYYGITLFVASIEGNVALTTTHAVNLAGLSVSTLYYYRVQSCDAASNCVNASLQNFTTTTAIDTQAPAVTLHLPANGTIVNGSSIIFNCSATDNVGVANATLYTNFSGAFLPVSTCAMNGTGASCQFTQNVSTGTYRWNCNASDTSAVTALAAQDFTFNAVPVQTTPLRSAFMIYHDASASTTPRYRTWNGTNWSDESSMTNIVNAANQNYVLIAHPNLRQFAGFVENSGDDLLVTIHNTSTWSGYTSLSNDTGQTSRRQPFDAAYESQSKDLVTVYRSELSATLPRYRVYGASGWSAEGTVAPIGSGQIAQIRLVASPFSDSIILLTEDTNSDVYGQVWNGSAWGNVITLETNAESENMQSFDAAYERPNGRAIVAWADTDLSSPAYRIWNGTNWSNEANANTIGSSNMQWMRLEAKGDGNRILLTTLDSGRDLNVQFWNGTGWESNTELDDDTETDSYRAFDIAWESIRGYAMVAYGDRNSNVPNYFTHNGSVWSSQQTAADIGGDPQWVTIRANPSSNDLLMMIIENENNDISVQRWNGTVWTDYVEVEISGATDPHTFSIAYDQSTLS